MDRHNSRPTAASDQNTHLGIVEGCEGVRGGGAGEGQHGTAADREAAVEAALAVAAHRGHLGQYGRRVGCHALAAWLTCSRGMFAVMYMSA